jgi:hypothetical protein
MKAQNDSHSGKTQSQQEELFNDALLIELRAHFIRLQTEHLHCGNHPMHEQIDLLSYKEVKTRLKKTLSA